MHGKVLPTSNKRFHCDVDNPLPSQIAARPPFLCGRPVWFGICWPQLLNNWGHGVIAKACWHGHMPLLKWFFQELPEVRWLLLCDLAVWLCLPLSLSLAFAPGAQRGRERETHTHTHAHIQTVVLIGMFLLPHSPFPLLLRVSAERSALQRQPAWRDAL